MMAQTNDWKDSRVTYDESTGSYRVDRDSSELLSTNVVLSIAAIEGVRPTQLPPLAQTIDPDALETVFGRSDDALLSFSYAGYRVTLDALGSIEVVPIGDTQPLQ
ncbi:HalOD1 output domain-containing protein [Haloferax chudinovii]|uniref:HalOD1 output domain-containing protein n=1 Tax=Haloferax chudinovii TaxID=1109010 RepID=A0ABD5X9D5_9EURY